MCFSYLKPGKEPVTLEVKIMLEEACQGRISRRLPSQA